MNIPSNQQDHPDTVLFKDVLHGLNLHNHISFPTHWIGNRLDIVIKTTSDTFITDLTQVLRYILLAGSPSISGAVLRRHWLLIYIQFISLLVAYNS